MASISPAVDEWLEYLLEKATPEQILAYTPSEGAQARATELLEKNSEGTLTPEDREELEHLRQNDAMIVQLKLKARLALKNS